MSLFMLVFLSGLLHLFTLPSGLLMGSTLQQSERYMIHVNTSQNKTLLKSVCNWVRGDVCI